MYYIIDAQIIQTDSPRCDCSAGGCNRRASVEDKCTVVGRRGNRTGISSRSERGSWLAEGIRAVGVRLDSTMTTIFGHLLLSEHSNLRLLRFRSIDTLPESGRLEVDGPFLTVLGFHNNRISVF